MADFYEIDFLPMHTSKSGDAITLRYEVAGRQYVHVVDGGYESTAPKLANHIVKYYGTNHINHMVVTHADKDHAEGLAPILENFEVGALWMLRPWMYADQLLPHFARYTSAEKLAARLREEYQYIAALEAIAIKKGVDIFEPFQGAQIGAFRVLAPSPVRYVALLIASEKTPQQAGGLLGALDEMLDVAKKAVAYVKAGWRSEKFSPEDTSNENEMSVVQYAVLNGNGIVLTGDAGRGAMTEAADYAPQAGLQLPGVYHFQVPHHGGRRNLSTEILDRWLGPRLLQMLPAGSETFTALISSAKEDTDHPRKAVVRAMHHRGGFICTTKNGAFRVNRNAPERPGWTAMRNVPYPDEQEE